MKKLLNKLRIGYPSISFRAGERSRWSPEEKEITYDQSVNRGKLSTWALLHELGHALLEHKTYGSDFELLALEAAAWQKATKLATSYGYRIDNDHIQDCLDSYRDWLHRRSTCPTCGNKSLQDSSWQYSCFNCGSKWQVTASRFCRPYRKLANSNQQIESSSKKHLESISFR